VSVRLNKLLAQRGVGARRKCDLLIEQGAVRVNGDVVNEPGAQVEPERDRVTVNGRPLAGAAATRYYVLNKPVGVITTLDDPEGRRTIREFLPPGPRLFPVGRLDADTSGLLILTNDGELAHRLMHPRYGVVKTYRVRLDRAPGPEALRRLQEGVEFEPGVRSSPARVRVLSDELGDALIQVQLHEGRYRQVRRMCEAVGLQVRALHRSAYGPLRLGPVQRGIWRELSDEEVRQLRAASARPRPRSRPGYASPRSTGDAKYRLARRLEALGTGGERPSRPERGPRSERPARPERTSGFERPSRPERGPRSERPARPERASGFERPARPERPGRPARTSRLVRPSRPERPGRPERTPRPERGPRSERPARPARASRFERPSRPERGPRSERPARPARASRFERPSRPERAGRPARASRPERTSRPERGPRSERPARPARTSRFERPSRPERAGRPARASRFERPSRPERAGRPARASRFERPSRPERAGRPARTSRFERPARPERPSRPGARTGRAGQRPARGPGQRPRRTGRGDSGGRPGRGPGRGGRR
jgi:23S rRNA pseudouridine2605 synthase